jgi:hypothetical protein
MRESPYQIQKSLFVVLSKLLCALGHIEIVEVALFLHPLLRMMPLHFERIIRSDDAVSQRKLP